MAGAGGRIVGIAVRDHLLGGRSGRPGLCAAIATAGTVSIHQLRRSISCLVQHKREMHALPRFDANRQLRHSAARHNSYMLSFGCFSHQCGGELDLAGRVRASGYLDGVSSFALGEDLGYEQSPGEMIRSWMHDRFHRGNILSATLEDFGVTAAWGCPAPTLSTCADDATYTVNFGRRR